jgi:hypothetical protein
MTNTTDKVPAKKGGDIAALKSEISELKEYLRKQHVWEETVVMTSLQRLGALGEGPNVTDPPKPPRP